MIGQSISHIEHDAWPIGGDGLRHVEFESWHKSSACETLRSLKDYCLWLIDKVVKAHHFRHP
ncbi:hypothetical protein A5707_16635 [Mycobacterium kyorinense]|uniref:Uncharacterized protein n=1 Tax=Mycobacterium kyorinense TaxID=487514 RepID=A0A1A2ZH53_9MYCO|nr:hypothetical protein A5707_16635 [Mycobacterium kyorinense]